MLWDGNRQIQEYTDEQIFTTVYEQNSFEPVARIVQLASHIEQKRLADIAYETRRFVRIGESEETINQRIQDKSQPLINIYHYHCNHLGTPQELTNQDGDVIWLSYDRAWGGSFDTIYKPQFVDNFALDEFEAKWNSKYPLGVKSWRANWNELSTMFKYSPEIRKLIYTTNAIENFNRQLRKVTKTKSAFVSDNALMKLLYLTTMNIIDKWTMPIRNWGMILDNLMIYFGDRVKISL